ncbi:MAG TPA: hypothetical protein VM779_10250 [Thermoanaerobaculia bacterium]|nr:hypothetical protein [Thermoanaerobaculia bacterium]
MRPLLLLAVLLAALPAVAQEVEMTTVIVPVVGSALGGNMVTWKTDVELVNDSADEVIVVLEPVGHDDRMIVESIEPGGYRRYPDLVGASFGLDGSLVPLVVRTSGRRSVIVRATAYGIRGTETFPPLPIPVNYTYGWAPVRMLSGLAFNPDYRTNVGLANLGTHPVDVVLGLQRIAGRTLAVQRIAIPANTLRHVAIQSLFPMITKGADFSIVVETPSRDLHVYASVVENATNAARFVQPTTAGSLALQRQRR